MFETVIESDAATTGWELLFVTFDYVSILRLYINTSVTVYVEFEALSHEEKKTQKNFYYPETPPLYTSSILS